MFLIDTHEPQEAWELIHPAIGVECYVAALNEKGYADYMWTDCDGKEVHVERKQWGEILAGMDKVEDQVRRHLLTKPEAKLILLIEGMATPVMIGTAVLKPTNNGRLYHISRESSIRLSQVYPWIYQMTNYVEVIQTGNYEATAIALAGMYMSDQKPEHTTMRRYYKSVDFHPIPQVMQLMGVATGTGIGEKRAIELIQRFSTLYGVITAHVDDVAEVIGENRARKLLAYLGRPDV